MASVPEQLIRYKWGVLIVIVFLSLWGCQTYLNTEARLADEREAKRYADWRAAIMKVCGDRGLEAVDIDAPHTPKCLNLQNGIMTVPPELYKIRGRM